MVRTDPAPLSLGVDPSGEYPSAPQAHPGPDLPPVATCSDTSGSAPLVDGVDAVDLDDYVAMQQVRGQLAGKALDTTLAEVNDVRLRSHVSLPYTECSVEIR